MRSNTTRDNSPFLLSTSAGEFSPSSHHLCPHSRQARLAGVMSAHSQLTVSLQLSADLPSCHCLYIRLLVQDGAQMVYTSLRLPMIQGIVQVTAQYSAHHTAPCITECVLVSSLVQGVLGSSALPDSAQVSHIPHITHVYHPLDIFTFQGSKCHILLLPAPGPLHNMDIGLTRLNIPGE